MNYDTAIVDFNSAGIRAAARDNGITHMRLVGTGYMAGHEGEADYRVSIYALPSQGAEYLVADTNGDPVWEEADQQGFAALAESCGIAI